MHADKADLPRLDPDSPKGCPRPMRELRRYVEAETGRVGHDFFFGRTAVIDGVRFWVWGIIDDGETVYVDVSERGGRTIVAMGSGEGRSVEEYVRARYASSWARG